MGMTQETLGGKLDPPVTRASVANIEGGKQRVLAHTLPQLAEALHVQMSEIVPTASEKQVASAKHVEAELAQKLVYLTLPQKKIKKLTAQLKANRRGKKP
jgi:transcriptional regulator with XRE-family HTH domain